jgi:hypothetical protein
VRLTPTQIQQYASAAGFRGNALNIAVAIAMAESGGNTTATHLNTNGTTDYGLWQINSVHSQYSASLLLNNPQYNAMAAWTISSNGSNFTPWTTFNTGAYKQYLSSFSSPITGSVGGNMQPWYTFPRVDNMGKPDPFGGSPKPDSNIQVPAGYPITALLPGTISGISTTDAWGASVTILLDSPLNSLADHTAYLHLRGDLQVRMGQRVVAGQLIAFNGSEQAAGVQKVPLGFALYHGSSYGHDGWQFMTASNLNGGMLDPVPLLNAAQSGKLASFQTSSGATLSSLFNFNATPTSDHGNVLSYTPITKLVHNTLTTVPGFYGIALALDEAEQFPGFIDLQQPTSISIPGISGITGNLNIPDFVGLSRSMGATLTDNFLPFAIRSGLVLIGLVLMFLLIVKALEKPLAAAVPMIMGAAEVAA